MSKGLFVLGITFMEGERGKTAILNVSRSLPPLDLTNFKRRVLGETGEVSKYDQPLHVNYEYALQLEKTGALVPRREYQLKTEIDYSNPLAGALVIELIPVDDEIKKHFQVSMGNK